MLSSTTTMLDLVGQLVRDVWAKYQLKAALLICLTLLNGLSDGIGLALLVPMLSLVGVGDISGGTTGQWLAQLHNLYSWVGLDLSLKTVLLTIILIFLLQNLIFLAQSWLAANMVFHYMYSWRLNLFSNYMNASWGFFTKSKFGVISNSITSEVDRVGGAFNVGFQLFSACTVSLIYIILSFILSWQVTTMLVIGGIVLFVLVRKLIYKGYVIGKGISHWGNEFHSSIGEFINGAKIIKATSTENRAIEKFEMIISHLRRLYFWSNFNPNLLKAISEFSAISLLCLILYMGTQTLKIDPATIIVISAVFIRLVPRLFGIQQSAQLLGVYIPGIRTSSLALADSDKFHEDFEQESEGSPLATNGLAIEVRNLSFAYKDAIVLSNLTLKLPPNKIVALVGSSGSGKTTLVDCILRLHPIPPNSIFINEQPLENISIRAWRKSIGYVSQETYLFHDTIKNNIVWGIPDAEDEDIMTVSRQAYVYDFVNDMPEGFDTVVGDRGVRLSGGQKQRIGLARALVTRPSILLLDEATSALDSDSEQMVLNAIEALHGQMSILMIAHRLSTVSIADYLYVLENGQVIEEGTWTDLLTKGERFKELWDKQSSHPDSEQCNLF